MEGQEIRNEMLKSLLLGMKAIAEERKAANGMPHFIELGGRLEAMRTIVDYLMGVDDVPVAEPQGCEKCDGECQGHPDSGGEEEGEAK